VLFGEDPRGKAFGGVGFVERDRALEDDRPAV
jgi:hypothetical protein